MGRLAVIASTMLLVLSLNAAALAGQPEKRQAQQRTERTAPTTDTGTMQYSCRLNPDQPPKERRKKVSLICEPLVSQ